LIPLLSETSRNCFLVRIVERFLKVFQVTLFIAALLAPWSVSSDPQTLATIVRSATTGIIGIIALSLLVELFDYLL
jgi:hypothetical protein